LNKQVIQSSLGNPVTFTAKTPPPLHPIYTFTKIARSDNYKPFRFYTLSLRNSKCFTHQSLETNLALKWLSKNHYLSCWYVAILMECDEASGFFKEEILHSQKIRDQNLQSATEIWDSPNPRYPDNTINPIY